MKSRGIKSLCSAAVAAALIVALGLASCVREPEITGVKLDKTSLSLTTGETATLTATIQPSDASGTVTWSSSDASVATVLNGSVVAVKAGTATITASVEAFKATCSVTVTDPVINVTGVAVEPASAAIEEEETVQLKATVSPANATNSTVSWSSADNKIATVSSDGLVTGVAEGSTKITASAGGMSGTCTITVSKKIIYATSITLDKTELELTEGESATLAATVAPENVTDPTVRWASSDEAVATVDGGVVTAVSPGTATVTATCGSVSAECAITVLKKVIPVSGITLDRTVLELAEGESADLTATVAPEDATDKTVTWSSSDEAVATVADGHVTAVAKGSAVITATAGDCSATCAVAVGQKVIPVSGITLDKTELELNGGETAQLTATVTPEDATDKTVTWSSSNEAVATVSADGLVKAVAGGEATITAAAGDCTATCKVTVAAASYDSWLGTWSVPRAGSTDPWIIESVEDYVDANDWLKDYVGKAYVFSGIEHDPDYEDDLFVLDFDEDYGAIVFYTDTLGTYTDTDYGKVVLTIMAWASFSDGVRPISGDYPIFVGMHNDDGTAGIYPYTLTLSGGTEVTPDRFSYVGYIQTGKYKGYPLRYQNYDDMTMLPNTLTRKSRAAAPNKAARKRVTRQDILSGRVEGVLEKPAKKSSVK